MDLVARVAVTYDPLPSVDAVVVNIVVPAIWFAQEVQSSQMISSSRFTSELKLGRLRMRNEMPRMVTFKEYVN